MSLGGDAWVVPYPLDGQKALRLWAKESPDPAVVREVLNFAYSLTDDPTPDRKLTQTIGGNNPQVHYHLVPSTDIQVVWIVVDSPPAMPSQRRVVILRVLTALD